ncbi:MAG: HAD family phosphatase [Acidobacteriota bacterium]
MKRGRNIDLAIFDMDGTIFTNNIDWNDVKRKLNVKGTTILEKIYNGKTVDKSALKYLEEIEEKNTFESVPLPGSSDFINNISERGIKTSLVTNNSRRNAEYLLEKYGFHFDTLITRDENMWKPSPSAFKFLISKFMTSPENTITIGDSDLDITASVKAGISDVYIIDNAVIRGEYPVEIRYFKDYPDLNHLIFNS